MDIGGSWGGNLLNVGGWGSLLGVGTNVAGDDGVDLFLDWKDFLGDATEWGDDFTDFLDDWLGDSVFENVGFIFR